jgi:hypothetical protein
MQTNNGVKRTFPGQKKTRAQVVMEAAGRAGIAQVLGSSWSRIPCVLPSLNKETTEKITTGGHGHVQMFLRYKTGFDCMITNQIKAQRMVSFETGIEAHLKASLNEIYKCLRKRKYMYMTHCFFPTN